MDTPRKILSILECNSNEEYWMELIFADKSIEEIESSVGRFVLQTLVTIKLSGAESPCLHLVATAITEKEFQEMRFPKDGFVSELEELMKDVESGGDTGDDS